MLPETTEFNLNNSSYTEISSNTGAINVTNGVVCLTIKATQPSHDAPKMATIKFGEFHPVMVKSGYKLYAKASNGDATITYTEK